MITSRVRFFSQRDITVDHVMASSAMPILFPWQNICGEPYWDGGVMANTPLFAALQKEIDEVIVVLLSPVGHLDLPFPGTMMNGMELVFEHLLSGSYQATRALTTGSRQPLSWVPTGWGCRSDSAGPTGAQARIRVLAPSRMLGFRSLLNFSSRQARRLLREGYDTARQHLGPLS